ncbi:hypothetical protein L218DRAFT_622057 [Marasmius fiardii PR-910]|nr:hypothetical protein L218DRAFT_622057 [Marasmius fiardii PR-910]
MGPYTWRPWPVNSIRNVLEEIEYSYRYNSHSQPSYDKLLGDTRSHYVLGVLSGWAHASRLKKGAVGVYWLQGSDSVWRSAIAQRLAKSCEGKELLATFFFSSKDRNRNKFKYLVLAIAHEMMITNCGTRDTIIRAVHAKPDIFRASVETQFETLVTGAFLNWRKKLHNAFFPLHVVTASSTLIILDGLDECSSARAQTRVLSLVLSAMENKLPVRFLICSRPTVHLQKAFHDPNLRQYTKIVSLDSDSDTPLAIRKT